ncbi:MAG TPA: histidinol dehydrogenase [Intrasporangium sp.]|uniref:histidinol dehydrogenase n=1 Tax=Intrasporangium sp. TaxID=1925024 RepID=UPI002D79F6A2|nr:histidinol dehydrogenase [Intrasporangium sp.]HET7397988.1 histidinol dehydrogenase [Intrasporangium sp.]
MDLDPTRAAHVPGAYLLLKSPAIGGVPAQRLPEVSQTVSEMLTTIERKGLDAVLDYSRRLDGWGGGPIELTPHALGHTGDLLDAELRASLEAGADRTRRFAELQREGLTGGEAEIVPGVVAGYHYVPVGHVGAYLPAGRFPILASAFMTVGVAKAAGVPTVTACTPPESPERGNPAVLYAAHLAGVDRAFVLGGVQALAAMAFGLLDGQPVDMLVGAGNAYVTEAKRQLFGVVGIDLLAGPSEVAVIADDTADAEMVAADLLAQAEHGPQSPAALVTTSRALAEGVIEEVDRQLGTLSTREIAGAAWRDYGRVYWVESPETAVAVMDILAPEHLEVITEDDEWYLKHLTNYGSLFLGPWSTVAYSDKGITGTNHVLPTGGVARSSAGLSVSRFLRPLTYQRVTEAATPYLAPHVERISSFEGMAAHGASATLRSRRFGVSH